MQQNEVRNVYCNKRKKRISQGDVIRELNLIISSNIGRSANFSLAPSFSYGVILSQECDLEQHYDPENIKKNADKTIETVLICPAFAIDKFLLGEHLDGVQMTPFGNSPNTIKKFTNNDEKNRYHYLPGKKNKFPELIIDFKRFYTVPLGIFDNSNLKKFYITSIKVPYKERLSQRFTNYLGRIGLPE